MITHNPLHGSGQAAFPHPALASGDDAKSSQRIRMTYLRGRQPAIDEPSRSFPGDMLSLAAPGQRAMPEPADAETKQGERRGVRGHPVVTDVSADYRAQPLADFRNRIVHASLEFGFDLAQLRLQSLAHRLPSHSEAPITALRGTTVREAQEVERLGLSLTTPLSVLGRKRAELQEPRLLGMQFQLELAQSLHQLSPTLLGIGFTLEPEHDVIGIPHDDHVAVGAPLTPCLDPEIEHVVEVDVRQERRCTAALRRPFFHPLALPILPHPGVQPFPDKPHEASVCNPVLDKLHQPPVVDGIEEPA